MNRFIRQWCPTRPARRHSTTTRLQVQSLEDRHVPSGVTAGFDLDGDHILRVYGTDNPDKIVVLRQLGQTSVLDNGTPIAINAEAVGNLTNLPLGWVSGIRIYSYGGDDTIEVRTAYRNTPYDSLNTGVPVYVSGGAGNDVIQTDTRTGTLFFLSLPTSPNVATVLGGSGNDDISGGVGDDQLSGESGLDTVHAGAGDDLIWGGLDNDDLSGDVGNDRLFGNAGTDVLHGNDGDDWLDAGSASESVFGGEGLDFNAWLPVIDGTDRADVNQGQAHTCSLMSTLAAASYQGIDLTSNISYLGNYHYTVRMFDTSLFMNKWVSIDVYFDGTLLKDADGKNVDPDPAGGANGVKEFWTVLYQRAYLSYFQHKDVTKVNEVMEFLQDSDCARTMKNVLGVDTTSEPMPWFAEGLRDKLNAGEVVTVGGHNHRYSVLEVFQDNGEWKVKLFNPKAYDGSPDDVLPIEPDANSDGVFNMKWSDFTNPFYFTYYTFSR